jgi:hypothetical protein
MSHPSVMNESLQVNTRTCMSITVFLNKILHGPLIPRTAPADDLHQGARSLLGDWQLRVTS